MAASAPAFDAGLDRNPANHVPLTPVPLLAKTAIAFPDRLAVVHGPVRRTWAEEHRRCCRLATALRRRGIGAGDTVAVMAPNTPAAFEAAFGVPMAGAVLTMLNTRLDAATIGFILGHGEARVVLVDREFAPVITEALKTLDRQPLVIGIDDPLTDAGAVIGEIEYEAFLAEAGDAAPLGPSAMLPDDEWDAIALNYTSGTTGDPKGVVYHHRGAFLNAMGNAMVWDMAFHPVYLWTLPMFHCNGWCFPWTITALAGTHVCLRRVTAATIHQAIADAGVTHLCGAPVVLGLLVNATEAERAPLPHRVEVMTAAAPPPAALLEKIERIGFHITHVYGLTEVYGPAVVCDWNSDWDALSPEDQAAKKARQGVRYPALEGLMVADAGTLAPVPPDGTTLGEVFMRGNIVMKGYLKNPAATAAAFAGGWFHTGDIGVRHPDGYIELKDRSKDIIISGGENISTIEVESVLYQHPDVLEAAVVAKPHDKWGETPCACVLLRDGATVDAASLIAFCRDRLAHFKCPTMVVFGPLPKTSTGKVQKFVLRARISGHADDRQG